MQAPQVDLSRNIHPNLSLREGMPSYTLDAAEKHPVQAMQVNRLRAEETLKFQFDAANHGFHVPLSKKIERTILGRTGRLPGLPSKLTGLETVMGLDSTIVFEDYLGKVKPELGLEDKCHREWMESKGF